MPKLIKRYELDVWSGEKQHWIIQIRFWCFCMSISPKAMWFRVFGRGLHFKHVSYGLTFGERNGHSWYCRIGKYYIGILDKPWKPGPV